MLINPADDTVPYTKDIHKRDIQDGDLIASFSVKISAALVERIELVEKVNRSLVDEIAGLRRDLMKLEIRVHNARAAKFHQSGDE